MKNVLLIFMYLFAISCSGDDDALKSSVEIYPLQLILVSSLPGNPPYSDFTKLTGKDMIFQEYYLLFGDSTFLRNRKTDTSVVEEHGTFERGTDENQNTFVKFTYLKKSSLRGSCTAANEEYLYLQNDGLYKNDWGACDGTFLEYEAVGKVFK